MTDNPIFDGKSLADVFSDIYKNTNSKREQINTFITKLVKLINQPEDAAIIAPIVANFYEIAVKNDEHIVRVAQIIQRIESVGKKAAGLDTLLTDAEKDALLSSLNEEVRDIKREADELDDDIFTLRNTNSI